MSLRVSCPECNKCYRVPESAAGKKMRCKACETLIPIPLAEVEEDDWSDLPEPEATVPLPRVKPRKSVSKGNSKSRKRKKKAESSSKYGWILGGIGVFFGLLVLARRVMRIIAGGMAIAGAGAAPDAAMEWEAFEHPSGIYQVELQGKRSERQVDIFHLYLAHNRKFHLATGFAPYPANLDGMSPVEIAPLLAKGMMAQGKARPKLTRLQNQPTLEFRLQEKGQENVVRMVLVPEGMIDMEVVFKAGTPEPVDVYNRFFNSFRLKKPAPGVDLRNTQKRMAAMSKPAPGSPPELASAGNTPFPEFQNQPAEMSASSPFKEKSSSPFKEKSSSPSKDKPASSPFQAKASSSSMEKDGSANNLYDLKAIPVPKFPDLGNEQVLPSGVRVSTANFTQSNAGSTVPGHSMELRVYRPAKTSPDHSLPCVLVGPAGSTLMFGQALDGNDYHAETEPYAQQGMVAVTYSIDGTMQSEQPTGLHLRSAYRQFREADAGLINARNTLEFALARLPEVDPKRIYVAGHSSAGTLGLLFAEHEPRLAACIAYAPCIDVVNHLKPFLARPEARLLRGLSDFAVKSSPSTHEESLNCPLFLFHARDDSNAPIAESIAFENRLKGSGKSVTFVQVPTGDHYDSMVQSGIPKAIEWLKTTDPHL